MTETIPMPTAESDGTALTRFNALRHGVLSRYTVLPWEDAGEYAAVLEALVAEHRPQGLTQEHLVEELAGILWRKRRLRLAEVAVHRRGLDDAFASYRDTAKVAVAHLTNGRGCEGAAKAVRATAAETEYEIRGILEFEAMAHRALDLLGSDRNDAYEAALAELPKDTQEWWEELLAEDPASSEENGAVAAADVVGLRRFIKDEALPWFEKQKRDLANRPLVREQAFGEAVDVHTLERLARYEVHLDRKLERTLAMLLRLKDLRAGTVES